MIGIKKILSVLVITGIFTLGSCFNGDDMPPEEPVDPIDLLPPLTFEGNNTFDALINGRAMFARQCISSLFFTPISANNSDFRSVISGEELTDDIEQDIDFVIFGRLEERRKQIVNRSINGKVPQYIFI